MTSINGDWFHSRSSSNLSELLAVRKLLIESTKLEYVGFNWSAGRENNELMYKFSDSIGVKPSTMQTKIRAMIRYGFIKDDNACPLKWTRMGNLWNDLYSIGNYTAANRIYELILTTSLAIYSFTDSRLGFSINPSVGDLPLKTLLNLLYNNTIKLSEFEVLVDGSTQRVGRNAPYWMNDLINSGIFQKTGNNLTYTGKYSEFIEQIKIFEPNPLLTDEDWIEIRENPLIEESPFHDSLKAIFLQIASIQEIEEQFYDEIFSEPLIDMVSEEEDKLTPEIDILSEGTRVVQTNQRVRNATWSIRIKRKYSFKCAVPKCDVDGKIFVEAAHIKPDRLDEDEIPHRAHLLNGLCLCRHCHKAFDKGFFTLTDDSDILISPKIDLISDQYLKKVIVTSNSDKIKSRDDNKFPLAEFIQYHREFRFRN